MSVGAGWSESDIESDGGGVGLRPNIKFTRGSGSDVKPSTHSEWL